MSRRDYWAIAAIWIGVFIAAFVFAILIADDDPSTDEGAGAGALAAPVGGLLTGVYLLVREMRARRKKRGIAPTGSEPDRLVVPQSPRLPRPREWWVDVIGAVVLWIIATVIATKVIGFDVGTDMWIAGLVPLAFLLARHWRRSRSER